MFAGRQRIAVVGSINRDTILAADGSRKESFGGILYSILALALVTDAEIYPVCNVGRDVELHVRRLLEPYTSVQLDGVRFLDEPNPHCVLDYDDRGNKEETLHGGVSPLSFDRLSPFLNSDAICFNFITGSEVQLEVMMRIRREAAVRILMDVHSLTLGTDANRKRFWRYPQNWRNWVGSSDVVQMNEAEGALLAGTPLDSQEAIRDFGKEVLKQGPRVLLITRGNKGSDTVFVDDRGVLRTERTEASVPAVPKDETGCGDVFLMGFAWAYLRTKDPMAASRTANRLAGINACLKGIDEISRMPDFLAPEDRVLLET